MLRRFALYSLLVLPLACGGSNTSLTPISPTPSVPTPTPSPAPPAATIAHIAGDWAGTHELQIHGARVFGQIALVLDQSGPDIRGTWRHVHDEPTPGYNPWHGAITGAVALTETGETRFSGTATIIGDIEGGTGACHGTVLMAGPSSGVTMRWEGPNPTFSDCQNGVVGGFVWIVHR